MPLPHISPRGALGAPIALVALPLLLANAPVTLTLPPDAVLPAQVNGTPARLLVSPDGPDDPVLNPDIVARVHISTDFMGKMVNAMGGISAGVGKVIIRGHTGLARIALAGPSKRQRVLWFDRAIAPGFDGELGPASLPAIRVTFRLRTPQPGEHIISVPLASSNFQKGIWLTIAGQRILTTWDPRQPISLASAATAQALATANQGALTGATKQAAIDFGIESKIRAMTLGKPLDVPGASLKTLLVRIADYGSTNGIADADANPNEIVVATKSKVKPIYFLTLGQDALAGCSSLTFDQQAKLVTLSCR